MDIATNSRALVILVYSPQEEHLDAELGFAGMQRTYPVRATVLTS